MPLKMTTLLLSLSLVPAAAMAAPAGAPSGPAAPRAEPSGTLVVSQAQPRASAPRFARGDVLPEAYRARIVKNPYHAGLNPPGRDRQWVQVGRTFYLIDRASGEIVDRVDV